MWNQLIVDFILQSLECEGIYIIQGVPKKEAWIYPVTSVTNTERYEY